MGEVDTSTGFFDSAERGRDRSLVRVRATFVHEWVFYVGVSMVHKLGVCDTIGCGTGTKILPLWYAIHTNSLPSFTLVAFMSVRARRIDRLVSFPPLLFLLP
jgi:hypothetical protein